MSKISKIILAGIISVYVSFPSIVKAEEHPLKGVEYPPFPQGVEEWGGWVTEDPYSVDRVFINGEGLLLLTRLLGRNNKGKAFFEVVTVLPLPSLNTETEEIMGGGDTCKINGERATNYVAIVKYEEGKQYLTDIRKVWRIEKENFVEINPQGLNLRCENVGFDL